MSGIEVGPVEESILALLAYQIDKRDWEQVLRVKKLLSAFSKMKEEGLVDTTRAIDSLQNPALFSLPKRLRMLYEYLNTHANRVITHEMIFEKLLIAPKQLGVYIKRLKAEMENDPKGLPGTLENVRGVGYRLKVKQ